MTNVQLYFAIGIPTLVVLAGMLMNVLLHNAINARFNSVDGRFNSLDAKFDILTGKVIDVDNRVTRIEAKLGIG